MAGRGERRPGYRKGDSSSGGGSFTGGGGKRGRPLDGWEKGDIARGVAKVRDPSALPRKPGRAVPFHRAERAGGAEEAVAGETIYDLLRAQNHKTLVTLRKLEDSAAGVPQERERLCEELATRVSMKRRAEEDYVFPLLLDHPELQDEMLTARQEGREIDEQLAALLEIPPADRRFKVQVAVLHGAVEQQIEREESTILPIAERVTSLDQAADLASRFRG